MTPTNTVFARPDDAGGYAILDNETGMPVTRLDASVYPIGSEFGARYEHAEGIRLSRADVVAAGVEFEYPSEIEDDDEMLPRVEDDAGEALDGDEILPTRFTYHAADGTEYDYRYTGPDEYEVRRWMPDESMWWVERSDRIGDEVTVDTFLAIQQAA